MKEIFINIFIYSEGGREKGKKIEFIKDCGKNNGVTADEIQ
jgi:hypothetical protein